MQVQPIVLANVDTKSKGNNDLPDGFESILYKFIISTPYSIPTIVLAYVSGNMWAYIILSYFSKKERKILENWITKICLGILWFALVLLPIYFIHFKSLKFTVNRLIDIIITDIVISLAFQAIVIAVIYISHRKEK